MASDGIGGQRASRIGLHHIDRNALLGGEEIVVQKIRLLNFAPHPVEILLLGRGDSGRRLFAGVALGAILREDDLTALQNLLRLA